MKRISITVATTVNDVVVALATSALRSWLLGRDELPAVPLLAMIPVSVRSPNDGNTGNRVSTMIIPIPTVEPDPAAASNSPPKRSNRPREALPATLLEDANEFIPPVVLGPASRWIAGIGARAPFEPPCNVVISYVRGSQLPLFCAGALLNVTYPVSPILDGVGLNVPRAQLPRKPRLQDRRGLRPGERPVGTDRRSADGASRAPARHR